MIEPYNSDVFSSERSESTGVDLPNNVSLAPCEFIWAEAFRFCDIAVIEVQWVITNFSKVYSMQSVC